MNDISSWVIELVKAIFYIAGVAIASGWITAALTQLLKWKLIAIPAKKYPTIVAGIISLLVAIPAVMLTGIITIAGWSSYVVIAVATLLVAVQSYDTVKAMILQIKTRNDVK